MAIDTTLLEDAANSTPVLRLYGFAPPCLSTGFNQRLSPEMIERARQKGFEIVRRPTGGRAVVHLNDLTYSFVACEKGTGAYGILDHSISASYRQICAGLQEAFVLLGLRVEIGAAKTPYRHLSDCFLSTTGADLHFEGLKIAGSAQLRRRGAVLQHGSIPLNLEQKLARDLFVDELPAGIDESSKARHANLFDAAGRPLSLAEMSRALKTGFEKAFAVELEEVVLKDTELDRVKKTRSEFLYSENCGAQECLSANRSD